MPESTLFEIYQDRRHRIERCLQAILAEQAKEEGQKNEQDLSTIRAAEATFVLSGGKRIRGLLTLIGYDWHKGTASQEAIYNVAAAAELFHAALLIHDDIIDRDKLRRGQKTLHLVELVEGSSDMHQRLSLALLSGDRLATLAYKTLLSAEFPLKQKFAALHIFEEEAFLTGLGAILDVDAVRRAALPQERLERTLRLKTARYTTVAPFRIGATLAGTQLDPALEQILLHIGEAFQMRDDMLGLFASSGATGKTAHSDLREGRQTFLLTLLERALSPKERKALQTFLGTPSTKKNEEKKNEEKREAQTAHYAHLLKKHGLEAEAEKEMTLRWEVIKRAINQLNVETTQKTILTGIGKQLVFRKT